MTVLYRAEWAWGGRVRAVGTLWPWAWAATLEARVVGRLLSIFPACREDGTYTVRFFLGREGVRRWEGLSAPATGQDEQGVE